jgi:sugar phosphate isomerase/epimerase
MKCSITISLVPEVRGGPFVFWDDLPGSILQAAKHGFHGVEIFPPGADAINVNEVRKMLGDNGLQLAAMGTGAGWVKHKLSLTSTDPTVRNKAEDFIRAIVDVAGSLGAPAIIGSMQGRWGEGMPRINALSHLSGALARLGNHARQYRVPILYEPVNRYETNLINTIFEASNFIDEIEDMGIKNTKVLADLFHMNMEESNIAEALRGAGDRIGHVHFVDSNRKPAGMGHMNYASIAEALWLIGYRGYLSAEAFPHPDPVAAAEQTIGTFRRFFQ